MFSGSVNEAGLFALRGKQDGSRRNRKTTTSTTTSTSTLTSVPDDVAQPAALLAPNEESWTTSSPTTTNVPYLASATSSRSPIEFVVKPHSKVILPCELEGNYSKLLQPGARYCIIACFQHLNQTSFCSCNQAHIFMNSCRACIYSQKWIHELRKLQVTWAFLHLPALRYCQHEKEQISRKNIY